MESGGGVRLKSPRGRGVLLATALGTGMVYLDSLVVNVALPTMDKQLHLGVAGLQWTISGYLLSLSALLLLGGSLGDLYGMRRSYMIGVILFVGASVLCGVAQTLSMVIGARILQGVGGALMTPASLAIIQTEFVPEDRSAAIGAWSGSVAFFTALGPFVGGLFTTYVSWRVAFFINAPLGGFALWASSKYISQRCNVRRGEVHPDYLGASLAAFSLGGITYWAIEGPAHHGLSIPLITGLGGLVLAAIFVAVEMHVRNPMLPLSLFKSHQFVWLNLCTVLFYGSFVSGVTFLGVQLQANLHYPALVAGMASLPVNVMLILLSRRFGALSQRLGAKPFMTGGPLIVAIALIWMSQIETGVHYWTFVLPSICIWGHGLSMVVAPLTSAALASADQQRVGVASAFNTAASRVGPMFAIALLPVLSGIGGSKSLGGTDFEHGYGKAMAFAAITCVIAGVVAFVGVRGRRAHLAAV